MKLTLSRKKYLASLKPEWLFVNVEGPRAVYGAYFSDCLGRRVSVYWGDPLLDKFPEAKEKLRKWMTVHREFLCDVNDEV